MATFLLIPKGIGLTLVTLLILPMGAANLPVMIKEIDSGQAYTRYLLTLPCSRKEIVQSRFCASFLDGLQDMALVVLFLVIDALWRHTFTPLGYLQLGLASLMIGLIYMAMNLVVSFLGNVTVTSVFLYDFRSGGDGRLYTGRLAGCAGGAAFVSESVAAVGRLPDAYSVDRVGLLWDFFEVV